MFSFRGFIVTIGLTISWLLIGVIAVKLMPPQDIDNDKVLSAVDQAVIRAVTLISHSSVPDVPEEPFNCTVSHNNLTEAGLSIVQDSETRVVVKDSERPQIQFTYSLQQKVKYCRLQIYAWVKETDPMKGHFEVNQWNRLPHLSVLFYDMEDEYIVHRAVTFPETLDTVTGQLRQFANEILEFQHTVVGDADFGRTGTGI